MKPVEQTLIEAGRPYIIAAASGNVVEYIGQAENGAELRLAKYEHRPEQEWLFSRVGENSYNILCRANGRAIDLMMTGTSNGTWLHLWDAVPGSSQVWTLVPTSAGTVRLINHFAGGKCMDTVGMGSEAGAILQIWQESAGADQLWAIRPVKDRKPEPDAEAPAAAAPEAPAPAAEPAVTAPAAQAAPAAQTAAETAPDAEAPAQPAAEAPAPKKRASRAKKAEPDAAAAPAPKKRAARTKKSETK